MGDGGDCCSHCTLVVLMSCDRVASRICISFKSAFKLPPLNKPPPPLEDLLISTLEDIISRHRPKN